MLTERQSSIIEKEISWQSSRSGGKGGQNVNKVETQVDAEFSISDSQAFSQELKELLILKNGSESGIRSRSNRHRSQLQNKNEAIEKIILRLNQLLKREKKRKPTRPSKGSKEKKLKQKKKRGETKELRRKII